MKNLRQLCAATLLTIALAIAVPGGEIDLPGTTSPSCSSKSIKTNSSSAPSASSRLSYRAPSVDWLTEAKINFWQNLISLF
jgi:hypothetical protein